MESDAIEIPRGAVYALLFSAFFAAYIFVPYWRLARPRSETLWLGALTAAVGMRWAEWSCGSVRWRLPRRNLLWLPVVGLALLAASWMALQAPIPWCGDEDYNIGVTIEFGNFILGRWASPLAVGGIIALILLAWRQKRVGGWLIAFSCLLAAATIAVIGTRGSIAPALWRWPYFDRLFNVIPPLLARPFAGIHPPEWLFRVVPFLAGVGIAWLPMIFLRERPRWVRLGLALVVGTVPLILYYSSLLYLETPAVFLMMIVCFFASTLLTLPPDRLREEPAWYALLLIGFIKETVAPFLIVFLLVRYAIQFRRIVEGPGKGRAVWQELKVGLCVMTPLAVYLAFRIFLTNTRPFVPHPENLLDWHLYVVTARAYAAQFGPILLLSAAGFALLALERQWIVIVFFVGAIAAQNALHIIDLKSYVGYSRFSLFGAPAILLTACLAADRLARRNLWATGALIIALLAANFLLWPLEPDGSRKSGWGNSEVTTTEWSYPYRDVCRWLNEEHSGDSVAFAGYSHSYFVKFYLAPAIHSREVNGKDEWRDFVKEPDSKWPLLIVYHLYHNALPSELKARGYVEAKRFTNDAKNELVVLIRRDSNPNPTGSQESTTYESMQW